MRKVALLLGILVLGLLLYRCQQPRPRWTTDSEEALREMQLGLDAEMKLYRDEAGRHYARAVALDPGFLAAKERLGRMAGGGRTEALAGELRQADLGPLSAGERFLVEFWLASRDGDREAAEALLKKRLEEAPGDPFALNFAASIAAAEGDLEGAADLNRKLIKVEPNWVPAQNMLGYLAMMEGQFAEAEEHFKTYQYIAPDQANPHDSMGELLLLLGRYDEAERELEMAIAVRPTFTASYMHLLQIAILEQDAAKAQAILGRVETSPELRYGEEDSNGEGALWRSLLRSMTCRRDVHLGFVTGDWGTAWARAEPCMNVPLNAALIHRTGLILGLDEDAARIRTNYANWLNDRDRPPTLPRYMAPHAILLHMDGNRNLAEGNAAGALELFRTADTQIGYATDGQALFKLYNLGQLAAAHELAEDGQATAVWQRITAVNPRSRPFLEAGSRPLLERARAGHHIPESRAPRD